MTIEVVSLWETAGQTMNDDLDRQRFIGVRIEAAKVWRVLTEASSKADFETRKFLVRDHLEAAAGNDPRMLERLEASLDQDFEVLQQRLAKTHQEEQAEVRKNRPFSHTYEPIGWDRFDSKPHPGSQAIEPGSKVKNHGTNGIPRGPGGMQLVFVEDEQGNHQTVDTRSLKKIPKGKAASLEVEAVSWGRWHYEDLASEISTLPDGEREQVASHFADHLTGTNPRYRPEQFLEAASRKPAAQGMRGYMPRAGTGTPNYSRGHYEHLARGVASYPGDNAALARRLSDHFVQTQSGFDPSKFLRAAAPERHREMPKAASTEYLDLYQQVMVSLEAEGMRKGAPFADYEDWEDCTSQNSEKRNPDAYCGEIKHQTEDKKKKSSVINEEALRRRPPETPSILNGDRISSSIQEEESRGSSLQRQAVMFKNPEEHAANPPETWKVEKGAERLWHLKTKDGGVLDSFPTKTQAEQNRTTGFSAKLYEDERKWYAGEKRPGYKTWEQVKGEQESLKAAQERRRSQKASVLHTAALDPTQMQPGDSVTVHYHTTDGKSGTCPATFKGPVEDDATEDEDPAAPAAAPVATASKTASFYVRRHHPETGSEGWIGPIQSENQAHKEKAAWESSTKYNPDSGATPDSGGGYTPWTAEVHPSTPEIKARVKAWQKAVKQRAGSLHQAAFPPQADPTQAAPVDPADVDPAATGPITYAFDYANGTFFVSDDGTGQWVDPAGSTFTFSAGDEGEEPEEEDAEEEEETDTPAASDSDAPPSDAPPWMKKSVKTAAMGDRVQRRRGDDDPDRERDSWIHEGPVGTVIGESPNGMGAHVRWDDGTESKHSWLELGLKAAETLALAEAKIAANPFLPGNNRFTGPGNPFMTPTPPGPDENAPNPEEAGPQMPLQPPPGASGVVTPTTPPVGAPAGAEGAPTVPQTTVPDNPSSAKAKPRMTSSVSVFCTSCGIKGEVALSHLARLVREGADLGCPKCGAFEVEAIEKEADEDFSEFLSPKEPETGSQERPLADEVHDVPSVKEMVQCSSCQHTFPHTATNPGEPLPDCPNCGSKATTLAGGWKGLLRDVERGVEIGEIGRGKGVEVALERLLGARTRKLEAMVASVRTSNPDLSVEAAVDLAERALVLARG